jgi:hypothetical protein
MKNIFCCLIILTSMLFLSTPSIAQKDWIFSAMKDEMDRSRSKLSIDTIKGPYYIAYSVIERKPVTIKASLGSLISLSGANQSRTINVQLRVGSYSFDNSNFLSYSMGKSGVVYVDDNGSIGTTYEDDYDAVRRDLWLASDAVYKRALGNLSKKKASLENKIRSDTTSDFSPAKPFFLSEPPSEEKYDLSDWTEKTKRLSDALKKYSEIQFSEVEVGIDNNYIYFLNSDGAKNTHLKTSVKVEVTAETQAIDGMPLYDFVAFYGNSQKDLPPEAEMIKQIKDMADDLTKLRHAPNVDFYSGPVLFEDQAAAEVVSQGLAANLCNSREADTDIPWLKQRLQTSSPQSPLLNKIGARILPDYFSVTDKPGVKSYENIPLIGSMNVDEEGVESQAVKLVDKGRLKSLLTSRMPHKRIYESNGHGRGYPANAFFTNLFVSSEKPESKDKLKKQLIDLSKDMGLEYGIIIRKLDNPHFKQARLNNSSEYYGDEASPPFVLQPVLVYKVYFDGREELVRGAEITGMTVNSFKEIVGASNSDYVYNHITDQNVKSMYQQGEARVSVITPSLLFESIDLKKQSVSYSKLPIVSKPDIGN